MTTLDIASFGARLSRDGNRFKIERRGQATVFAPIEDVDLVVIHVPGVDVSGNALCALSSCGIPAMICGDTHRPVGWLQPVGTRSAFTPERARRQAKLPERTQARVWRTIVQSKVRNQAAALSRVGKEAPAKRLRNLAKDVAEGDPTNVEATAARVYWPSLFGSTFRRRGSEPRSQGLDFGYAVLRAMVCRSLVAAGLHPDLGVSHRSPSNGFNLADDLIEPYRPIVDLRVHGIACDDSAFEVASSKQRLSEIGEDPIGMDSAVMRCRAAVAVTAASFARFVDTGKGQLALPMALVERDADA